MSDKLPRKVLSKAEWIALFRDGLHGGADAFARHIRKLVSRLGDADPEISAALAVELGRNPVLRSAFVPNPVDADSRLKLLRETYPVILPAQPVWAPDVAKALGRVVTEWRGASTLREAGLTPARSVLISGPPGVGKTLAASWLAMELDVPLLTLDLATVMNSFLGKTGQNLRLVLNHAMATPSVLLLDEFDAIAKRRDDDSDVGELKRLVNVLLQAVDNWSGESLLVAATNHPDLLDRAVWRRFDLSVVMGNPEPEMTARFLLDQGITASELALAKQLVDGASFAHVERWLRMARKDALLSGTPFLQALLGAVVRDRHNVPDGKMSRDLRIWTLHLEGKSAREIGREVGLSHPTVQRVIRCFREKNDGQE